MRQAGDEALSHWIADGDHDDRNRAGGVPGRHRRRRRHRDDDGHVEPDQLGCKVAQPVEIKLRMSLLDGDVPVLDIAEISKPLTEGIESSPAQGRMPRRCPEKTNLRDLRRLLPARRERPNGRTTEQGHELAPLHSITSSARPSSESGTVRPSAFAVLRFMSSSILVDCWTGRSAGLSPLSILPA